MNNLNQRFKRLPVWIKVTAGAIIVLILVLGGLIIVFAVSDFGAPCTVTFTKDHTLLNVPGSTEQVADVRRGQTAPVLRRTIDGWVEVKLNGTTGWAYADPANFVETSGFCAAVPVVTQEQIMGGP